jgi:hypothetical protein
VLAQLEKRIRLQKLSESLQNNKFSPPKWTFEFEFEFWVGENGEKQKKEAEDS